MNTVCRLISDLLYRIRRIHGKSVRKTYTNLLQNSDPKAPKWLDIIWKGRMVEINGASQIRRKPNGKKKK